MSIIMGYILYIKVIILLYFLSCVTISKSEITWKTWDGNLYYFSISNGTTLNQTAAHHYCQHIDASLASVLNDSEKDFLVSAGSTSTVDQYYWIGLENKQENLLNCNTCQDCNSNNPDSEACSKCNTCRNSNSWVWLDGHPVARRQWNGDQPNENAKCVKMHANTGSWYDTKCKEETLYFICKKQRAWESWNGHQYYFSDRENKKLNQTSAANFCAKENAKLASISNVAETNFITNNSIQIINAYHWIGLEYKQQSVTGCDTCDDCPPNQPTHNKCIPCNNCRQYENWQWTDGQEVNWSNWHNEQPNDNAKCVKIQTRTGKWYDDYCNRSLTFVCKKAYETDTTSQTPSTTNQPNSVPLTSTKASSDHSSSRDIIPHSTTCNPLMCHQSNRSNDSTTVRMVEDNSMMKGIIAGVVVAIALIIAVLVIIVICVLKRRRNDKYRDDTGELYYNNVAIKAEEALKASQSSLNADVDAYANNNHVTTSNIGNNAEYQYEEDNYANPDSLNQGTVNYNSDYDQDNYANPDSLNLGTVNCNSGYDQELYNSAYAVSNESGSVNDSLDSIGSETNETDNIAALYAVPDKSKKPAKIMPPQTDPDSTDVYAVPDKTKKKPKALIPPNVRDTKPVKPVRKKKPGSDINNHEFGEHSQSVDEDIQALYAQPMKPKKPDVKPKPT